MKILIIEDEELLAQDMSNYLRSENFVCELAFDYASALDKVENYEYDCIILDITLPGGSGLDILRELKRMNKSEGVIIVSARNSLDDKISGLQLGADDYLPKPFHMAELGARVQAIVRRRRFEGRNIIQFKEITVDTLGKTVSVHNMGVPLTKKEFELLLFLMANKNRVISKNAIAEHLSGDDAEMMDNFDFVYAHMKNLKKKLLDAGCTDYIKTVYGLGYKFSL